MVNFYEVCSSVGAALFEYNTNKIVHIRSKTVGFINRFIQLLIIGYVIGYAIIWNKGYQTVDDGLSSVTTKVKGIARTNLTWIYKNKTSNASYHQGLRTWDSADYVTPAEEYDAIFVMTNMILTPEQKQGKCPEYGVSAARCKSDSNCTKGKIPKNGHGEMTGKCVLPDPPVSGNHKMCEIQAWCPVENSKLPMAAQNFGKPLTNKTCLFEEAVNFTILIKNTVRFPTFEKSVRNINDDEHEDYLKHCEYNDADNKLCPIIRLKTIFDEISGTTFNDTAVTGGIVGIKITWDCNLDSYDISECRPKYSFLRLDDPNSKIAPGYNIRIAQYDKTDKRFERQRTLIKAYGIRFVIMVDAKARKFDIVPLLRNFGAGLGLLGLATVLCDICVLYFLKKKSFYRSQKYLYVDPEEGGNQVIKPSKFIYRWLLPADTLESAGSICTQNDTKIDLEHVYVKPGFHMVGCGSY